MREKMILIFLKPTKLWRIATIKNKKEFIVFI